MRRNIRVKPSRGESFVGFIVGIVFVGIGIFIVLPSAGGFGVFWTLIAIIMTASHGINAFGKRGIATHEIEVSTDYENRVPENNELDFEEKLRKLKALKDDGIITLEEFEKKKSEILNEKW